MIRGSVGESRLTPDEAELVRVLEANGLARLAATVARQIVRDRMLSRGLLPVRSGGSDDVPVADRERAIPLQRSLPAHPGSVSATPK